MQAQSGIEILVCYAREDELLLGRLERQLEALRRQHIIRVWYDRDISAGADWEQEIDKHLNTAQIILLLISPDFMASNYCNGVEVKRAMKRHETGEARVIPVILRPVYWKASSYGKLQALPRDARPVTEWGNRDKALFEVAEGIRKAVQALP